MDWTQEEIDNLCVGSQLALVVLMSDFVPMCQRKDLFIQKRFAQMLELNNLSRSIKDYNYTDWDYLSDDDLNDIRDKIVFLSEWRD